MLKIDLLIFIIGILSYLYILNNILNNNFEIIFLYFPFLLFGYFFIKSKIFILGALILFIHFIKKKFYIENNENIIDNMVEEEEEDTDPDDFNIIEFDKDDKKDMEKEENQNDLIETVAES